MTEMKEFEISLNNFIEPLKQKKKGIDSFIKELELLKKLLKEPVKNAFLVSHLIPKIESELIGTEYYEALSSILVSVHEDNKKNQEEFIYVFGKELKEVFEKEGIAITGNYPDFSVKFCHFKIDFKSGNASLYFARELVKSKIKLTAKNILNAYKEIDKEIVGRPFNGNEFIKLLYDAYQRALLLSGMEQSKRLNIVSVLKELALLMQSTSFIKDPRKENYRSYSRAYFSYDLFRLKQSNMLEYNGKRLHLGTATIDYADKDNHSIFIVDEFSGGNYIMSLSFMAPSETK